MAEHKRIIENIGEKMGFTPEILEMIGELDPRMAEFYKRCDEGIQTDGALPAKTKVLMALGIVASQMCESCVESQMRSALNHGATREEILETIGVVLVTAGAPAVAICKRALKMLGGIEGKGGAPCD